MKTKVRQRQGSHIRLCSLIGDIPKQQLKIFTKQEIAVFNTYYHFLDLNKTSWYLIVKPDFCSMLVQSTLVKLHYLYDSESKITS